MSADPTPALGEPIQPQVAGKTAEDVFMEKVNATVKKAFADASAELQKKVDDLNARYDTLGKAVIKIDERQAPNQPQGQAAGKGMTGNPLVDSILGQIMPGQGGAAALDPLTQQLVDMQKQQYLLWMRSQVKAAQQSLGLIGHVSVEG